MDVLRPLCDGVYAALRSPEHPELREKTKAPQNCIWEKQIDIALHWIQAFLAKQKGALERVFTVNAFNGVGVRITIRFDASPWGLGGILLKEEVPVAWIAAPITEDDIEILGVKTGDCASQQVVECLAQLVCSRAWTGDWQRPGTLLGISAENVTSQTVAESV